MASPMVNFAWRDVAFTIEGGTHVEAGIDQKYRLSKLVVSKHGWTCSTPTEVLEKITEADINNIKVFEEPHSDYALIRIHAYTFDDETGSILSNIVWSLRFDGGRLERVEQEVTATK